jgi:serine/threonine protein kinase
MTVDPAQVKSLFLAAADLADPAARAAFLDRECGGDALRQRVEALLQADAPAPTADHPPTTEPQPGTVIAAKYRLAERIGEGGMGSVWLAHQSEPVKRKVALKLIKPGMDSKAVLARFEAERQALALMDHPNIARVLDGGLHDGRPFFVMELVKGVPITEHCDARKLTPHERLELFVPVCQAIQHAHQKGIIHRDIKPSNVLVALYDDRPVPKVIDFGVAKATGGTLTEQTLETAFGGIVGTPQYMSPEQASLNNLDIDTRADVYSLGVLLYELLAGSPPFARKALQKAGLLEILRVVREEEPPRPSLKLSSAEALPSLSANRGTEPRKLTSLLRNELDWIVMKALEKDRTRRYETANGLAADVNRYLAGEPVLAHPPSAAYRLRKFVRRHRTRVLAASLVLLALVAGMIGTTLGLVQANQAAEAERLARKDAEKQQGLAEQAAAQERQAKVREAQRADGEKKAKFEAEAKRLEAERNLAFARKGNDLLGSVFAGLDPKQIAESGRPLQDVLRQNLRQAVKELEGSAIGDPLEVAAMQNTLGLSLLGLGEEPLAIEVFQKSLNTRQARLGPDHLDTVISMNNLATAYRASGQLAKAVLLYEETLKKCKAQLGPDDPRTLSCMNNLAGAYMASGQLDRAVTLHEETLEKRKARLGPDHPDTLLSMNNLAEAYSEDGKLDLALPLFEETLDKLKARPGPNHPHTLTATCNLARAYLDSGQLARALPLYEEVLQKQKASLGPDHPDTLNTMNGLAGAYEDSGQLARALSLFEETLEKRKAKLGLDHPDTLQSMNNLACAYRDGGQLARALPLLEETLQKRKAKLDPDHPGTLESMINLAEAYRVSRQFARAVPLFEETLKKCRAKLSPDHPLTLTCMHSLALAYRVSGQLPRAVPLFEETLKKRKTKLGPDHPNTLTTMNNLAGAYHESGQLAQAVLLFEETLDKRKIKLGPDHPATLTTMNNLAAAYRASGQLAKAVRLLEETLEKSIAKLGPDHPHTLASMGNLGKVYAEANQGEKAATTLTAFVDGMRKRVPNNSTQFAGLLAQVALALIDCGQHAAAEPLLRESLAISAKQAPDAWFTFNTQALLGGALLGQKKYAEAEPLLLKGYEGMKKRQATIPPAGKVGLPEAVERLVQLYDALGKVGEAGKWRQEQERYLGKVVGPVHEVGTGLQLQGQLDAQTPTLAYQVKLVAGKTYVIDMISPDPKALDPYLFLLDAAGKKLAEDDDSGGGLNARIIFRVEQDGVFRILATSFNAGQGAFTLTVREQAKLPRCENN